MEKAESQYSMLGLSVGAGRLVFAVDVVVTYRGWEDCYYCHPGAGMI